ncbi:MAG: zinc finger protein [Sandaracinus sp.]
MAERKIELTWVCSSCQTRNRGRDKVCTGCGNPKDASERFEMPGETRSVASVTDAEGLRAASAGRDWRCPFCRADNTALASACKQCGAVRGTTPAIAPAASSVAAARAPLAAPTASRVPMLVVALVALGLALGTCVVAALFWVLARSPGPSDVPYVPPASSIVSAHVEARSWATTRVAMRHRLVPGEGFAEAQPPDAVDVTPDGVRHHHDDQVEDGMQPETYTEDVPYQDTETYTEQVPCGQDCTPIPETCHEECTDDGNGFASCHDVCSGGGQSCTPRTCSETRTRQVTRTRPEMRTRMVPRYRTVPRDAPWFRWRAWAWVEDRRAERRGTSEPVAWASDEELGAGAPLGEGEDERIETRVDWEVTLRDERGGTERVTGTDVGELEAYPIGAAVSVELDPYGHFTRVIEADAGL